MGPPGPPGFAAAFAGEQVTTVPNDTQVQADIFVLEAVLNPGFYVVQWYSELNTLVEAPAGGGGAVGIFLIGGVGAGTKLVTVNATFWGSFNGLAFLNVVAPGSVEFKITAAAQLADSTIQARRCRIFGFRAL